MYVHTAKLIIMIKRLTTVFIGRYADKFIHAKRTDKSSHTRC